jgi:hypothetical protein
MDHRDGVEAEPGGVGGTTRPAVLIGRGARAGCTSGQTDKAGGCKEVSGHRGSGGARQLGLGPAESTRTNEPARNDNDKTFIPEGRAELPVWPVSWLPDQPPVRPFPALDASGCCGGVPGHSGGGRAGSWRAEAPLRLPDSPPLEERRHHTRLG